MEILFLVGSLRRNSINAAAAASVAEMLPVGVQPTWFGRLDQLPHFDPDIEELALPEPVARLRCMVGSAAAVVICCPEYAHGASGLMKTSLEWLVGGVELAAKPVMLVNASTSAGGGLRARRWLEETLAVMGADVRPERVSIAGAAPKVADGRVIHTETLGELRSALGHLLRHVENGEIAGPAVVVR